MRFVLALLLGMVPLAYIIETAQKKHQPTKAPSVQQSVRKVTTLEDELAKDKIDRKICREILAKVRKGQFDRFYFLKENLDTFGTGVTYADLGTSPEEIAKLERIYDAQCEANHRAKHGTSDTPAPKDYLLCPQFDAVPNKG